MHNATEHEIEPVPGLPAELPRGETMLWQGKPSWRALALRAFHARSVALYFGLLMVWRSATTIAEGGTAAAALVDMAALLPLVLAAMAILCGLAWLSARATLYTVTTRRVVMRFGVALPMTVNLPHKQVGEAALKLHGDGTGDIPLAMTGKDRLSYILFWPHVRPWRLGRPEPMLRCIPEADKVSGILAAALARTHGQAVTARSTETADASPAAGVAGAMARASAA